jgi:hypothetical protein
MREAKSKLDRTSVVRSKRLVGAIVVHLQGAGEVGQLQGNLFGAAAGGEHLGDRRGARPELAERQCAEQNLHLR